MEIEYYEPLRVENFQSQFAVPLRPDAYQSVVAGKLTVNLELHSEYPLKTFQVAGKAYALKITEHTQRLVRATFDAGNVGLTEDMTFDYSLNPVAAGGLRVRRLLTVSIWEGSSPRLQATASS
jgi:hypothetical protein